MVATRTLGRAPWWVIGFVTGAAAALTIPGAAEFLVYDRAALSDGELWRILTAHLVHFSCAHLLNNLPVLAAATWLVETRYKDDLAKVLVVAAAAIGAALFLFDPGIQRYAGASGLSLALLTYAALRGLREDPRWRAVCVAVLVILATKIGAECLLGWHLTDWDKSAGFVTVPLVHAAGAAAGFVVWLSRIMLRGSDRGVRSSPSPDCISKGSWLSSTAI